MPKRAQRVRRRRVARRVRATEPKRPLERDGGEAVGRWKQSCDRAMRTLVLALVVIAPLAGCAAFRGVQAQDTEELLAAAGFHDELAESPAQLADLHAVPPLKMITHSVDGIVSYRYADPYHCRCFYVGG